jgi:hypothetical protein
MLSKSAAASPSLKISLLTGARVFSSLPQLPPLVHPRMFQNIFPCPLSYPLVFEGQGVDQLV